MHKGSQLSVKIAKIDQVDQMGTSEESHWPYLLRARDHSRCSFRVENIITDKNWCHLAWHNVHKGSPLPSAVSQFFSVKPGWTHFERVASRLLRVRDHNDCLFLVECSLLNAKWCYFAWHNVHTGSKFSPRDNFSALADRTDLVCILNN